MNRNLLFQGVSLTAALSIFTIGITQSFAQGSEGEHHHRSEDEHHHQGGHSHGRIEITPGQPIPQVNLIVHPDPKAGWNLEIQVENFQFAPHHVNQPHQPGVGHAHLFINGEKITRIYGSWYYLKELPPGNHEVTVVLSSNNHDDFVFQGQLIQDTEMINH
ncbi:hypothetical protein [Roseofilum sp. Guam]|uniref:hypothetical protein n=1 Tax=Roseofilum sp. Guam TaxID=2821502 RepID=UPI001B0FE754|nr:hypothetical protein [Roseofilum sp. Guam]MBP0027172.1 hypothetical protein [Roseofilum sp. Guam]